MKKRERKIREGKRKKKESNRSVLKVQQAGHRTRRQVINQAGSRLYAENYEEINNKNEKWEVTVRESNRSNLRA